MADDKKLSELTALPSALEDTDLLYVVRPSEGESGSHKMAASELPAGDGDVVGPSSAVDGRPALFDGTTGKLLKEASAVLGSAAFVATSTFDAAGAAAAAQAASQPVDGDLTDIAALTPSDDDIIQRKASHWVARTIAQYLADLQGNGSSAASAGFRGVPQRSFSADTSLALTDNGGSLYHPSADTTARTVTIPANGSVTFPVGSAVTICNDASAGVLTIAITTDTLVLAGAGTTGSRSLAANGIATLYKMTSTRWQINGTGLS